MSIVIVGVVVALFLPSAGGPRATPRLFQCRNNLKQIALALKQYEAAHHALPSAFTTDANGKPLHSWRTLILPYLEQQELYDSIDLTKPWDDPANAEACKAGISAYQCALALHEANNLTTYLAVVTPSSYFRATRARNPAELTDPAKQTLLVIDAGPEHAVPWMSPNDADENLVLRIGAAETTSPHPSGVNAAFADGSIQFLPDDLSADKRRALISIAGNDDASLQTDE